VTTELQSTNTIIIICQSEGTLNKWHTNRAENSPFETADRS